MNQVLRKITVALRAFGVLMVLSLPTSVSALDAKSPELTGPVILTVVCNVEDQEQTMELDLAAIRKLPIEEITTKTSWTEGAQVFRGVRLLDLLAYLETDTQEVTLFAANDYQVVVPIADSTTQNALVAFERNGKLMSLRDKGPLWLVYPYDMHAKYRNEVIYARSIWQLDRMELSR